MATRCWTIDGLSFALPEKMLTPGITRMCDKGWYEVEERRALHAHLIRGDTVLEIGGGAGLLACVAARAVGPEAVTTVEANPAMLPVIRANLAANDADGVRLLHGAVTAGAETDDILFNVPRAYWAASLDATDGADAVRVPALSLPALIAETAPSVLVVDVEGAEAGYFDHSLPSSLRLIVLELHPERYDRKTLADIFARLAARGFAYDPRGSSGAVVCLSRY
ncbi:methyltransferase, FkbM family [Roseivivax marinus]|uniref:FkbM family methyltransferase n=1 Tax=Roseivivax marinus TaxID=1379903 RepID=UPI0008D44238|nr:FkbM family methyltransferase [Roseivivax marinus]SEL92016.1 methyltransferase, FkbM family [Roseivivax marinus]